MFRKELMYWACNKQTLLCPPTNYRKERLIACHPETTRRSDKEDTALSQLSPLLLVPEKKRSFNKSINQYQDTTKETTDIPMVLVINYNALQSQATPRNHVIPYLSLHGYTTRFSSKQPSSCLLNRW